MNTAEASVAPGGASPGAWLKRQRKAAGLTQEDLAERSGVSVRTIADLERGRTRKPYPSSLRALVQALGLPETAGTDLVARYRIDQGSDDAPPWPPSRHSAPPSVRPAAQLGRRASASAPRGARTRRTRPFRDSSRWPSRISPDGSASSRNWTSSSPGSTAAAPATTLPASIMTARAPSSSPRSAARPASARRRLPCTGRTGSRRASPTGSCTRTCGGLTCRARPLTQRTCCADSSTRSACTRHSSRPTSKGSRRSTAVGSRISGSSSCSTTPATSPRSGRCCPPHRRTWSS